MKAPLHNVCPRKGHRLLGVAFCVMLLTQEMSVFAGVYEMSRPLQEHQVSGTVTSKLDGSPLPGVNVLVKGTSRGVVTDNNGTYTVSVSDQSSVLVFSFIGFISREVPVSGRTVIDVDMEEDVQRLEELVIVGYGTQEKVNLTGSVGTVNFDKVLENRPITNASQSLGGQLPGVWVTQTSGQPGTDEAVMRIRGWGTLNNAEPMVVINGVEGSIDMINPNDIQSITVLKDAASAAIYGSKAANGVILITTKSGGYESKAKVSFSSFLGFQSLSRKYDIISNSAEHMELWNQARANVGQGPLFPESLINDFKNNNDPYLYPNVNYFDHIFRTASMDQQNVSVSGGSERSRYFFSANRMRQDGIMKNTDSKRYTVNLKMDTKLKDWITVGMGMNAMQQNSNEPYSIGRVSYVFANGAYPFIPPYNADGTYGAGEALDANGNLLAGGRNPMVEVDNGYTRKDNLFARFDGFADIKINQNLTFKTNFTAQNTNIVTDRYNDGPAILNRIYSSNGKLGSVLDRGQIENYEASRRVNNNFNYVWFNTLNFAKRFGQNHNVGAIAGMQVESTLIKSNFALRKGAPKSGLTQVSAGTMGLEAEGGMSALRMLSYFGRANYSYADKYLFEMNLRADASSRFAEGYRWGVFPGFSAGWRVTGEEFMESQSLFSELKLRASWGQLGNQDIAGYWPYLTTLTQNFASSYNFGGSLSPGAAATAFVNESITWETTTATEVGLEMYFLQNRLSVEATFFNRKTTDIITRLPIPALLGNVTAPYENVGEMVNNGFDIEARYTKSTQDRNQFGYSVSANLGYVVNEVTKFRKDSPNQLYLIREGVSYRSLYAYQFEGVYRSNQEGLEHMHSNGYKPVAGDFRFTDVNNDGVMNADDMVVIGNTIPKFSFGGSLDFTYKGFNLNILLQGLSGVTVANQTRWAMPLGVSGGMITKRWRDAWTPENPDSDLPMIKINDQWGHRRDNSFYMTDLTFLKAKNIQLGYNFENGVLGLDNLYLYVNLQNYFHVVNKGYEGFDPERSTFDIRADTVGAFTAGFEHYPLPKIISLGLNLSF